MRHARPLVLIFAVLIPLAGCGTSGGSTPPPSPAKIPALAPDPEAEARAAQAEQAAAEAKAAKAKAELAQVDAEGKLAEARLKADNAVNLGREAAKRSLVQAATVVGVVGAAIALVSGLALVASFFVGGIGRKTALIGLALAAGCIEFRFFVLAHGLIVSEAISWAIMAALILAGGIVATLGVRYLWHTMEARSISLKRSSQGEPGIDAIAVLPVSQPVRGQLHDAWELIRTGGASGPALEDASKLLSRFGLVAPAAPALQTAGAAV